MSPFERQNCCSQKVTPTLLDNRQKGDYADYVEFDAADVRSWIDRTIAFVTTLGEVAAREMAS